MREATSASEATVKALLAQGNKPLGHVRLRSQDYVQAALFELADTISWSLGVPVVAVTAIMDTMPADFLPLLDDFEGWWTIAEAVAEQLGHSDHSYPVLLDRRH
ncbi:hypothetical protein LZ016_13815 [Sphingomonas sp. SM33]|uniref:Uncharacterized protein n=1 Tax=Sphingomonas telluris TaxID=2907998 RepID=A0ABS9VQC2_9SPHN|nr:hypothetical protein [Sphingomonas telluris]MCH8617170.1 hypothetical protein [Sphingomonas telluris]